MEMKSYLKAELARMYFPMLDAPLAMRRLRRVYTNLKVYHFLIKKCTTPNRLQRYA